jgi:hypothetical protein
LRLFAADYLTQLPGSRRIAQMPVGFLLILVSGAYYFRRMEKTFADVV